MYEKISDKPIREDKVKRLKIKILTEIEKELKHIKNKMETHWSNDRVFDCLIKRSFALLNLKQFIEREDAFTLCEAEYPNEGVIVYQVSDKNLEIWLQEDYSFVTNFLFNAEKCEFDIFPFLSDRYFGYYFTNIFDSILYDKKISQQEV